MGLGAYSIQRSAMKRGCGAIPGFRCFCVMLHYGCCENQHKPSNLASSAMKNRIGRATAREPKGGQHTRRFQQRVVALTVPALVFQQGLDTTTPAGKMMFQVLGSFAEYERDMIRARVNAGIARAKAAGKPVVGRPWRLNWRSASVRHWLFPAVLASG